MTHANFAKGYRGGERQTQLLVESLAERGYTQTLLVRQGSELIERCAHIKNLTVKAVSKPYIFHGLFARDTLLIHAHETKAAQFAYWLHLFFNTPYIVTRRVDNPLKTNLLNKLIYTKAKRSVAVSNIIKKEILRIAPNADTAVVPDAFTILGVNEKRVEALKQRFQGKTVIGNVAALDNAHKGQSYLIDAARKLHQSHPDLHFLFLGDGIDREKYAAQAKGLDNITFEGFVDNVGDYLSLMDLFVFPSLHEGLGSSLFDAMRFDIPVIATDVGGIPDIITHNKNGLLIPPKESDAIVHAILQLLEDHALTQQLTEQAHIDVQHYSPDQMCEKYLKLYQA